MRTMQIRVILVRPEQGRNVGAVVRAAANFQAESVALVAPAAWNAEAEREARIASSGAWDVVGGVRIFPTIPAAASGCRLLIGTSGRERSGAGNPGTPAAFFADQGSRPGTVGVIFGPESQGLTASELRLCSSWICIPSDPRFSSLNLSQAALVVLYEGARWVEGCLDRTETASRPTSDLDLQERVVGRVRQMLMNSSAHRRADETRDELALAQLRRLLARAEPSPEDVAMLLNLLKGCR